MVMGHAMNDHFAEALDLFSEMLALGVKPNHVTFLGVLQSCTHGGFLEKGHHYFDMMKNVYQIEPRLEHYASMVDLFSQTGNIKLALLIMKPKLVSMQPPICLSWILMLQCPMLVLPTYMP